MSPEAITEHEHLGTTTDQPRGDSTIGLRGGIHGDPTWHPNSPLGEVATAVGVNLRFDRIEDRLISLERMLCELIRSRSEPQTASVRPTPELQPEAAPRQLQAAAPPQAESQSQAEGQSQSPQLPAWEQRTDDEELDVSVRDYIERLLKRGTDGPLDHPPEASRMPAIEPPTAASTQDAVEESPPPAMEPAVQEEQDVCDPLAANRFEDAPAATPCPASLTPLRQRPEREANLEAMRAVANLSATAAIRTYEKSQAVRATVDRLPLLLIGLLCGLMLLYSATSSGEKSMLIGAGVALVGAALAAGRVLVMVLRWLAASQPVPDP
jgi:hypothetical protein